MINNITRSATKTSRLLPSPPRSRINGRQHSALSIHTSVVRPVTTMTSQTRGPSIFPPGKDKHHIVVLEAIHVPLPTFDFPHTITLHPRSTPQDVTERVKDASIVIACVMPVLPAHLDQAPALGCLSIMAAGISWVKKDEFAQRNVSVTNCPGANSEAVAEHVLALYFGVTKRVAQLDAVVKAGTEWRDKGTLTRRWRIDELGRPVPPLGCAMETMGILGYGHLGRQIEKIARAVGFGEVLVAERKGATDVRSGRVAFGEVIKKASTIVVCVPKEDDTVGLIGERELKAMRSDAIVINVARGGIVDEAALARALREGWIAGAATDVLEDEPGGKGTTPILPGDGEEEVPNLVISPHIAWFTQKTINNYQQDLKDGIERWVHGTLQDGDDKIDRLAAVHNGKTLLPTARSYMNVAAWLRLAFAPSLADVAATDQSVTS